MKTTRNTAMRRLVVTKRHAALMKDQQLVLVLDGERDFWPVDVIVVAGWVGGGRGLGWVGS